jgi:hypothetical protein
MDKAGKSNKKSVRRGMRKTKKMYQNFKVYYVNTRGIKSKINSLERIANELHPQVICITETMLGKKEKIEIQGYENFYNNNVSGKGGIVIAIKNELKEVTVEVDQVTKEYQSLWIKIDNGKNRINIGCIYAPQENKTKIATLNQMYNHITTQVKSARLRDERIVITGDFNAKIGENNTSKEQPSKSGKQLLKMALEQELTILNRSKKCTGRWTRISGNQKSTLDYILLFQEDEKYVAQLTIDEEKENTPKYKEGNRWIHSDHCAMNVEVKWTEANIERHKTKTKKVITDKSIEIIKSATEQGNLTDIAKENTSLDEKYNKWQEELSRIIDNACEAKKRRNVGILKIVRKINLTKKNTKNKGWSRKVKKEQIKLLNNHIENEIKLQRAKATMKIAQSLQSDTKMHAGTFYEFKRKMDRREKGETPSVMVDKNGKECSTREEIKEIFEEFYKDLTIPI